MSFTTIVLFIFFILTLMLNGDVMPLTRRGFFCDDPSIRYPFNEETVNLSMLMLVALVIPAIVMKICDIAFTGLIARKHLKFGVEEARPKKEESVSIAEESIRFKRRSLANENDATDQVKIPSDIGLKVLKQRTFSNFQLFFFGFSSVMLLTGIGKITLGRLRPHFFQRCQPNINCSAIENESKYIEEFTCTNSQLKSKDMSFITTSWPSGHAAIMFYSMLYLIIYLETVIPAIARLSSQRVSHQFNPLISYAIYILMIGLASFVALTRVSDYYHHPLDVLSGSVMGSSIAIALSKTCQIKYSHKNFSE